MAHAWTNHYGHAPARIQSVLSDHLVGFVQAGSAGTRSTRAMNDSINLHARRTARSFNFKHARVHAAARAYDGLMCTQGRVRDDALAVIHEHV